VSSAGPTGKRVLERPPSERYVRKAGLEIAESGSAGGAVGYGLIPAVVGVAIFFVLAGPMAFSAGLVVVAIALGAFVGLVVKIGGGSAVSRGGRAWLAVGLVVLALLVAEALTWRFALSEGGVLPFFDYLGQTFGWLVPVEFVAGIVAAWITAR